MAITVGAATTNFSTAGTQTPTIAVPTGAATGDQLWAFLSYSGDFVPAAPSGWTEVAADAYSASGRYSLITRAMASGVTQAQWTLPTSSGGTYAKMEVAMLVVKGGAAYTAGAVYNRPSSGSTSVLPAVTVPSGGLLLAFAGEKTSTQTTVTAPSGMTEQAKYIGSTSGGGSVLIATSSPSAGTSGAQTVTYGVASANAAGVLVAVAPASGSVPSVTAGANQTVAVNTAVSLTSTISGATSQAWTQTGGPTPGPTIGSATSANATVTPTVAGIYTFRVTATNASGTAFDEVTVTVTTMSAKPIGVVVNPGGYVPVNAGALEDATSDGSDLTWDESGAANASITYQLPPLGTGVGYALTLRSRFSTTPTVNVRVEILQGTTVIATRDFSPGTSLANSVMTLTTGEISAMGTNKNALSVRVSKLA